MSTFEGDTDTILYEGYKYNVYINSSSDQLGPTKVWKLMVWLLVFVAFFPFFFNMQVPDGGSMKNSLQNLELKTKIDVQEDPSTLTSNVEFAGRLRLYKRRFKFKLD